MTADLQALIPALFASQARLQPDAPAIRCPHGAERGWPVQVTYGELYARAARLASVLRTAGVGPDVPVAVYAERSPDLLVAYLGALLAGGAYLPLDPTYPTERVGFMLADARTSPDALPPILLTQSNLIDRLPAVEARIICLESDWETPSSTLLPQLSPADLAYIIYTSGSTGQPKGVEVEHGALANLVHWFIGEYNLTSADRCTYMAGIGFDASVSELWPALATGACIYLPDEETRLSPEQLRDWLVSHSITFTMAPTPMAECLLDLDWPEQSSLRTLFTGGDRLRRYPPPSLPFRLANNYGPTEFTCIAAFAWIPPGPERTDAPPIGRPIAHTDLLILDEALQPVPDGSVGELFLGGAGLARGYRHNPDLTAERFVQHRGARLYRTGDLARRRPDGAYDCLGRTDHQVKIRGFRIELGEVESVMSHHPAIGEVAVVACTDPAGERLLAAYYSIRPSSAVTVTELRQWLHERLPAYMLPSAYVPLLSLPLTSSGKIDRRGLPSPDWFAPRDGETFEPPQSAAERALAAIWSDVLGTPQISRHDTFLALGGHSLRAAQVVSRARTVLASSLTVSQLLGPATLSELAAQRPDDASPVALLRVAHEGSVPLTGAQKRVWFWEQLYPGTAVYNIPWALRLSGELSVPLLAQALAEVVGRHEALRTTFTAQANGDPVALIQTAAPIEVPVIDLTGQPTGALTDWLRREAASPFDLARGPLLRAVVLRLAPAEHVLFFNVHHICFDGWSQEIFYRELAALYASFGAGKSSPLPSVVHQYGDVAHWERGPAAADRVTAQLPYWQAQFTAPPPVLTLPTDRPRPARQTFTGGMAWRRIDPTLTAALRAEATVQGATLYTALLAVFAVLLHRYTAQESLVIGTPVANRPGPGSDEVVGFFVNTLPIRADLTGGPAFRALLQQLRSLVLGAHDHQEVPFDRLVEALHPVRDPSFPALCQVMFAMQTGATGALRLPGLTTAALEVHNGTAKFDLLLSFEEADGGLQGALEYNADLFDPESIERMWGHLVQLLQAAVAEPDRPITEWLMLTEAERHQLLVQWNETASDSPIDTTVHACFRAQAIRTPEAVAVVDALGGALTYAELDQRSDAVAYHLQRLGAGPGTFVGLCLERSTALAVALLGVLKSGSAFVPFDPSYPQDRVAFMLADSGVRLLLTQESLRERLPLPDSVRAVCLDREWPQMEAHREAPRDAARPVDAAYVIYTSGSTGRPKGVVIEHRSLVCHCWSVVERWGLVPTDRLLQFVSISFDTAMEQIFPAWVLGAAVIFRPDGDALTVVQFQRYLEAQAVTVVGLPVSFWHQWLRTLAEAGERVPASLRVIICGGEKVLAEQWALRRQVAGPQVHWLIGYGPTETTIAATFYGGQDDGTDPVDVPIGRPIANTRLYVLDHHGNPQPIGVPGELHIGGAKVARGYLNRPDLTAERFVPDPYHHGSLYRTGDLVRYRPDGQLEFLGRIDQQVKIRGFRVELGEIETALIEGAEVEAAAVVVHEVAPGDQRLVGYLVPAAAGAPDMTALRSRLQERLPGYMLPAAFIALPELPLTPNGKVDRKALPAPTPADFGVAAPYVAPRTPVEQELATIWAEALRLERVGLYDDFFALGGHSLLAIQVLVQVRARLGVELPMRALFDGPTVAGLAQAITSGDEAEALPPLLPGRHEGAIPLSLAQQRLWFLAQLEPENASYNIPLVIRLSGPLDEGALSASLSAVVQRHSALHTRFLWRANEPLQEPLPEATPALAVIDLTHLPATDRTTMALDLARQRAQQPFDLEAGPPVRTVLLRLTAQEHWLLFVVHHVAFDGWSTEVLLADLSALYAARVGDRPTPPPTPIQYTDFALWQRDWLQGEALERQLTYWQRQLAGAPPLLALPTDRPRPAVRRERGGVVRFEVPAELVGALRALARTEGSTLFMLLLATFNVLLARYSEQEEICVGTVVANRRHPDLTGVVGFFANTLALRTDLSGDPSFRELLKRVREVALGAFAHQDVPFDRVVEVVQPPRDPSYTPVFQAMLILNRDAGAAIALPDLQAELLTVETETAKRDLTLSLWEGAANLGALLEYDADLFDAETAARMVRHWLTLLQGAVAAPGERISRLPFFPPAEASALIAAGIGEMRARPPVQPVHKLIEAQALARPETVAVRCGETLLTYAQLDERANQLAGRLQRLGVEPERLVAICLERSVEMAVAILAVLKAGGGYVPLDPRYPQERLAYILQDAAPIALVTEPRLRERLGNPALQTLCLDEEALDGQGAPCESGPDQIAYVIYTSGSTGLPKGVAVPHRSLFHYLQAIAEPIGLTAADRYLHTASFGFSSSVRQLLTPLAHGAEVVLATADEIGNPLALMQLVQRSGVTVMDLVPSYWQACVQALQGVAPGARQALLANDLRLILSASEPLPADLPRAWAALGHGARLINMFGQTETTGIALVYPIPAVGLAAHGLVPVGRPLANTTVYLLDRHGQPVPEGAPGELYIAGETVARGYWNRPDLTAERFLRDPFRPDSAVRVYRTGDLARRTPDGTLHYLGRRDHQVKIRGFRVELGEVESVLRAHPAVAQALVHLRETASGDQRLVAFLVPAPDREALAEELRSFLQQHLPDYMVPAAYVTLPAFPLTPTGKIDRKALPDPDWTGAPSVSQSARSHSEAAVAAIWAEVLRRDSVGVTENFFALGGHSLLAIQVMARLRDRLGAELPVRTLFEHPTVAALAALLDDSQGRIPLPPLRPAPRPEQVPLSFAQQRLWFLHQMDPDSAAYNLTLPLRLQGALDLTALQHALDHLVARHEPLRTRFGMVDGEPVQVIDPPRPVSLTVTDLRHVDSSTQAAALGAEIARPFDLEHGPLFRAALLRLGEAEQILVLTMHHIVADGWSLGVLMRELRSLYTGNELPPLPVQYADFALWQRQWLQGDLQVGWWQEQLAGCPTLLELPTDHPRPPVQSGRGAAHYFTIDPALHQQLQALCQREGVTPFMLLLAAFQALLGRYARQSDVIVGSPVAGRNQTETEGLIGFFVNTLILRTNLGGEPTFRELLSRVREVCLGALAHQDLPFEMLVDALHPERSLSHAPLVQVLFALNNTPTESLDLPGLQVTPVEPPHETARVDLALFLEESSRGLTGAVEYSTDLFDRSTIARMMEHFVTLLAAATAAPETPLPDLPLLPPAEEALLGAWNQTSTAYPRAQSVHALFADQAARTPGAPAIQCGSRTLTYGELDSLSNRIAGQLQRVGAGPGALVAVCADRSPELIAALLAILKVGGAYVPLDPTYPRERLAFMLADIQAPVVLTERHLVDQLPTTGAVLLLEDDYPDAPDFAPAEVTADAPAYVIYTSGSTGRPKGVLVPHRGIVRLVMQTDYAHFGPAEVLLQCASISFDAATLEIWGALLHGARLALLDVDRPSLAELASAIERYGVTTLLLTAGLFQQMVDTHLASLRGLHQLMAGGDVLSPTHVRRVLVELPNCRMINVYGPTENTTFTTCYTIPRDRPLVGAVPIGRPIANTQVYILDERQRPVPVGLPGELYTGGDGLAIGYLNRPELTAERFVRHPLGRLYRTGDLARYLPDGRIEFLGRLDQQVKLRGFRIELGEIETLLTQHPAVREATVILREERLIAYVVPDNQDSPDLRSYLRERLPEYMVPSAVVVLPELPLTPNGKVDRRALPAPAGQPIGAAFLAPRTPVEVELAALIADLLQVEAVGLTADFFELGGHSLKAMQLIARVRERFGVELSVRTLFEHPTVAGLSGKVEERLVPPASDLEALLAELEQLSPEEQARMLAALEKEGVNS